VMPTWMNQIEYHAHIEVQIVMHDSVASSDHRIPCIQVGVIQMPQPRLGMEGIVGASR
jgi:hypothetical protein